MRNTLLCLTVICWTAAAGKATEYSWQKPHVRILPNGDLQWAPEPYVFRAGPSVRHIDYENGDDSNTGTDQSSPWKHHPWDADANGKAQACSGVHTYVFRRGVTYRGQLSASESGEHGKPIRLASDPSWGKGEARVWGSERLPAKWVEATSVTYPKRLAEPSKVWALDLKAAGLMTAGNRIRYTDVLGRVTKGPKPPFSGLFVVNPDGSHQACHLARSPNWQRGNDNFVMDYWHRSEGHYHHHDAEGNKLADGFVDSRWRDPSLPQDYFNGGYIWKQYAWLMGTPTPSYIDGKEKAKNGTIIPWFYPKKGAILHTMEGGDGKGGLRYMFENLPQFLDAAWEYYIDQDAGFLFLRTPDGVDPNRLQVEMMLDVKQIRIHDRSNIEICGLSFSFTSSAAIEILEGCKDINIHHCRFEDIIDKAVYADAYFSRDRQKVMDRIRVADCEFINTWASAIDIQGLFLWNSDSYAPYRGLLRRVDVLRNRIHNNGMKHSLSHWDKVPAINIYQFILGEVAGNIVTRSFGSGIVVYGGKDHAKKSPARTKVELPLIRVLVHHNKTEDTALGVNDYGGMALWMGGVVYCYNNIIGNSPGHMPAGFWGSPPTCLSYPLYLDGGYKMYCFNNIIWGRTTDPNDLFGNKTAGYFMVFGFLNQFFSNTLVRNARGVGGSSGNRNDIVGNLFVDISELFFANNRMGDPSLAGGGDDASSGLRGVPSLVFAHNVFHGKAKAGKIVRKRSLERSPALAGLLEADSIDELAKQMKAYPIRYAKLGQATDKLPLMSLPDGPIDGLTDAVDFRPAPGSCAIDAGADYFVPWSLHGTVGEWHFTENHRDPKVVVDYHWYMGSTHFHRMIYEYVPSFDLRISEASLDDYVASPSEDWANGALRLDGKRSLHYPDALLRKDLTVNIQAYQRGKDHDLPVAVWENDGTNLIYPARLRKTPIITTHNLLVEAKLQVAPGSGGWIVGKHEGGNGYRLFVNTEGKAVFQIASGGQNGSAVTQQKVNDGRWRHILAEVDRKSGRMAIYVDGKATGESRCRLAPEASLDCRADFLVGKGLRGALDFLRVCRGTLEDSETDIAELYEWQTNGPSRYDYFGNKPVGRRDAGAIEGVQ